MSLWLRQSTASQEILLGRFVDSTDGNTQETGLTIANTDIKLWVEGATTLASKNSGGATHIANGMYYAVLDATDTATLGKMEVHVHVAGALAVKREFTVVSSKVYDALFGSGLAEPTAVFAWPASPADILAWLGAVSTNPISQTGTVSTLETRAGGSPNVIATADVSDSGSEFRRESYE